MAAGRQDATWGEQDELILRAAARVRKGLDRDPNSGLLVFREHLFCEAVDASLAELGPAGVPLSVVLADLDHFGRVNDAVGHLAGDLVLAVVGSALRDLVRPLDMVLAGGGDAYLVVLLGAGLDVARARAETMREALAGLDLPDLPSPLTASLGVAAHSGSETAADLFDRGFLAQLRAKGLGRDRAEIAEA